MILKSFVVEKNIEVLDKYNLCLFYGENIGLKDEIKDQIKKKYKNYEKIIFNQDEVIKNEKLIDDQINNISLFSNNKLIIISEVSDKIKNKISEIIEKQQKDIKIFLFAQNLEKKSTLRSIFEKESKLATIPCYQDNHRTLSDYTQAKLKDFTGLNQETLNLLIDNSGLDRKVLLNEINKIKCLFLDKKLNQERLIELLNYTNNIDFDKLRDSCLEGDKKKLNENLGNITLQNEDVYYYISSLNLRIEKLLQLHDQYKITKNVENALDSIKPKIFWKDKPIFLRQMNKWNSDKLKKAKKLIIKTEVIMKTKFNNYNGTLIRNLLISLYRIANSTS